MGADDSLPDDVITLKAMLRAERGRYENLADMEKKRAARDADPAWGELRSRPAMR